MPRDPEYDRLRTQRNIALRSMNNARHKMNYIWHKLQRLQAHHSPLLADLNDEFRNMNGQAQRYSLRISRAFRRGKRKQGHKIVNKARNIRRQMTEVVAESSALQAELSHLRYLWRESHVDYSEKQDMYQRAQHRFDQYRHQRNAFNREAVRRAEVPLEHRNRFTVVLDKGGTTSIYYGGRGKAIGPGHGHVVLDRLGSVISRRDPRGGEVNNDLDAVAS